MYATTALLVALLYTSAVAVDQEADMDPDTDHHGPNRRAAGCVDNNQRRVYGVCTGARNCAGSICYTNGDCIPPCWCLRNEEDPSRKR